MKNEERFYVLEHAGVEIRVNSGYRGGSGASLKSRPYAVEVLVLDRVYSHRVVWSSWQAFRNPARNMELHRARAREVCDELNAWDVKQMAAA